MPTVEREIRLLIKQETIIYARKAYLGNPDSLALASSIDESRLKKRKKRRRLNTEPFIIKPEGIFGLTNSLSNVLASKPYQWNGTTS